MTTNKDNSDSEDLAFDHSLQRIFDDLVLILKHSGVSEDSVVDVLRRSYATVEVPDNDQQSDASLKPIYKSVLGKMISMWRTNPLFVDDMANPKPLPLNGPDSSMRRLYIETVGNYPSLKESLSFDDAIFRLIEAQSVSEAGGIYTLILNFYPISAAGKVGSRTQLAFIADYVRVAAVNTISGPRKGLFQRLANTPFFPVDQVPFIRSIVEDQGQALLEHLDAILEEKKLPNPDPDIPTVHLGLGMYLSIKEDSDEGIH